MLRRVYHTILGQQRSASLRTIHERESVTFLEQVSREPSDFLESTDRYALSIIFTATYAVRLANLKHPVVVELFAIWDQLLRFVHPGTILPDTFPLLLSLPKWLQPWHLLATRLTTRELDIHQRFLNNIKTLKITSTAPDCYAEKLLKWQEAKNIDDGMLLGILAMLIGAGSDTTSTVIQNFFKVMALHPDALVPAYKELDQVVGRDRLTMWEDQEDLPYLRALIKEVHRWAPTGSLDVPHGITEDILHEDLFIPRGTIVMPNLVSLNRDPDRYEDPDMFKPTRFLGGDTDAYTSALAGHYMDRDHFHYGFGRRLCQGIHLAEDSLFIAISRILWAFDIRSLPDHPLNMADKIWTFTTRPKPFKISIVPRDDAVASVIRDQAQRTGANLESI